MASNIELNENLKQKKIKQFFSCKTLIIFEKDFFHSVVKNGIKLIFKFKFKRYSLKTSLIPNAQLNMQTPHNQSLMVNFQITGLAEKKMALAKIKCQNKMTNVIPA